MGRPKFEYTDQLADEICQAIATSEKGLHLLCKANDHWPHVDTVHQWILTNKEFSEKYARAKALQADYLFEQIIDIADNPLEGTKTKTSKFGTEITSGDMTEHRRLQIEARKFTVARLLPKKYGDKIEVDQNINGTIVFKEEKTYEANNQANQGT